MKKKKINWLGIILFNLELIGVVLSAIYEQWIALGFFILAISLNRWNIEKS